MAAAHYDEMRGSCSIRVIWRSNLMCGPRLLLALLAFEGMRSGEPTGMSVFCLENESEFALASCCVFYLAFHLSNQFHQLVA